MAETNGTTDGAWTVPPWAQLPPDRWVHYLERRVAHLSSECAMKDAYIDGLHQTLAALQAAQAALVQPAGETAADVTA